MSATPYNDFLEERCQAELGCSYAVAELTEPDAAHAILRDVMLHRWPHLRRTA